MKRFAPDQIERFLRVLDEALARSAEITIIGGSALALGYGVASVTNDIDTFESDLGDVAVAAEEARSSTGLEIPIGNSTVAQLPEGAELRRRRILEELTNLRVFVLDPHDLAASKLLRGNEHDRSQLRDLHALEPLSLELLLERYVNLLANHVGDTREARWAIVHFVEEVWGELAGVEARRAVGITNR